MKLNELMLIEGTSETYMVELKDGGGFNVTADSMSDARSKAKGRLRPGQVINKIIKDRQGSSNMDDKKARLTTYVANNRKLQQSPSQQKSFTRQIKRATTPATLQDVSNAIDAFVSGDEKKDDKKEEKSDD